MKNTWKWLLLTDLNTVQELAQFTDQKPARTQLVSPPLGLQNLIFSLSLSHSGYYKAL